MATTSKFIPFKTDNEHIKNGYVQNGVTPKYTNIGAVNAVRPGSASTNTTNLSLNQNLAKRAEQAGVGTNAYMPTANATSPTYLNKAYDPLSKTAQEVDWKYNAVTRDGTSYMPTADRSAYNATLPTKNGSGSGSASGGVGGGYGSGGITGYANFTPSDAYNQAMAYTNQLLAQLSSGRTSYTDQINSLMDTINNRAAFSYDPDTDPLFQQYLASSMESGKTAMQDTMAQASALTGGYGSTYATAAANGAYNNFIQDAYNNLPEYYQTALDTYNSETSNLYNKLGMYNTADQIEYDRLANAYQNNFAMANDIYGKDYNNYWDALNYNTSIDQYNQDLAYKYANLAQDQAQFNAKMAYQKEQDALALKNAQASAQTTTEAPTTYKAPSSSVLQKALSIYNKDETKGGGLVGVEAYVDSLGDDIDVEAIADYVLEHGRKRTETDKYKIKSAVANS